MEDRQPAVMPPPPSSRLAVTVVEVGPRDGLQNEPGFVPTPEKLRFVDALAASGLPVVEITSFVNPAAVPQLADADALVAGLARRPGVRYPVLVPNQRGLDRALAAGATEIALFAAASDAFSTANVGTNIEGTFDRFAPVAARARSLGLPMRGYVSVAFGCPYSGDVRPAAAVAVARRLLELGCAEISLADTIGRAHPDDVDRLLTAALPDLPADRLALHLHDTGGRALANVERALDWGIATFDTATGGLGGCPFAPKAPGNLATERLVDFLHTRGIATGVDRAAVAAAARGIRSELDRSRPS